ncbi:MAG: hypothetical protein ACMUIP_16585 [bacterium]
MTKLGAVIDLGSNTIRFAIGKYHPARKEISIKDRSLFPVRIGEGFASAGKLLSPAMDRSLKVLEELKSKIDECELDGNLVKLVATGVIREAENSDYFCESVKKRTGFEVTIISGDEEARIIATGVLAAMSKVEYPLLICDIGGGSTELIRVDEEKRRYLFSCPMGVVRLTEQYQEMSDKMQSCIDDHLDSCPAKVYPIAQLIATAGTPTTLAAIAQQMMIYNPRKIQGYWLSSQDIDMMASLFGRLTIAERRRIPGMPPGREDIILAGTIILQNILKRVKTSGLTVSEGSLLEGLLIELFKDVFHESDDDTIKVKI